jgi:hypothetical protein
MQPHVKTRSELFILKDEDADMTTEPQPDHLPASAAAEPERAPAQAEMSANGSVAMDDGAD